MQLCTKKPGVLPGCRYRSVVWARCPQVAGAPSPRHVHEPIAGRLLAQVILTEPSERLAPIYDLGRGAQSEVVVGCAGDAGSTE